MVNLKLLVDKEVLNSSFVPFLYTFSIFFNKMQSWKNVILHFFKGKNSFLINRVIVASYVAFNSLKFTPKIFLKSVNVFQT